MTLKLIKNWEEIDNIKNNLRSREESLVIINNKYFILMLNNHLFKNTNQSYNTEFELMDAFDGNMNDNLEYHNRKSYNTNFPGGIISLYKSYNIEFYGPTIDILLNLNSKIILAEGANPKTSTITNFVIFGDHTNNFPQPPRMPNCSSYSGYIIDENDENHITLTKSVFLRLDPFFEIFTDIFPPDPNFSQSEVETFLNMFPNFPLHNFYAKLVLQLINPMEFI